MPQNKLITSFERNCHTQDLEAPSVDSVRWTPYDIHRSILCFGGCVWYWNIGCVPSWFILECNDFLFFIIYERLIFLIGIEGFVLEFSWLSVRVTSIMLSPSYFLEVDLKNWVSMGWAFDYVILWSVLIIFWWWVYHICLFQRVFDWRFYQALWQKKLEKKGGILI